jgi:hypothetical protein
MVRKERCYEACQLGRTDPMLNSNFKDIKINFIGLIKFKV